ncbi:hypothetical protein STN0717ENT53_29250 [Enterobacter kobei]|nr:hypothetical protein STN0717ENT53_29250 [Enterobacter kobei]
MINGINKKIISHSTNSFPSFFWYEASRTKGTIHIIVIFINRNTFFNPSLIYFASKPIIILNTYETGIKAFITHIEITLHKLLNHIFMWSAILIHLKYKFCSTIKSPLHTN